MSEPASLVDGVIAGDARSLARAISAIENRTRGYRDLVGALYRQARHAPVIGITGSPGAGKSTLVDQLTASYRECDLSVGVVGIDPSSPVTGGAILGDRVRLQSTVGDPEVFVRSMSTRGTLGGLSPATSDVITAFEAYGMERIIVETVGAGQNEVDVVRLADTVVVVLQPGTGDDVQMLKSGILEIADVFVVNKADQEGVDRTVAALREMLSLAESSAMNAEWKPPIVETVATTGAGTNALCDALDRHRGHLERTSELGSRRRQRSTEAIQRLIQSELSTIVETTITEHGGMERLLDRLERREIDPYRAVDELLDATGERLYERASSVDGRDS